MKTILQKLQGEPIIFVGIIQAIILLAVNFGFSLTEGQQGAIIGIVVAVTAVFGRSKVSPVATTEDVQ